MIVKHTRFLKEKELHGQTSSDFFLLDRSNQTKEMIRNTSWEKQEEQAGAIVPELNKSN